MTFSIEVYISKSGKNHYREWLESLDRVTAAVILRRVERLKLGNFEDVKPIGDGLSELRIHRGAGYRVYFGSAGREIILLLCGSDKSDQAKAIRTARSLWKEYRGR